MHDHSAFLAAIVASPDDDLPRLVYADWLEESGEPGAVARAEFIRTQCELERCSPDDDRRALLTQRAAALLKQHREAWTADVQSAQLGTNWQFRRGFLHGLRVPAQRFAQVAEELFRLAPTVRAVQLEHGSGQVQGILRVAQLGRVADLNLSVMCTCGRCPILNELRTLFASPLIGNLAHLALAGDRIDPETAAALVSSPHLNKLRTLDLSGNALGLGGVRVLAAARGFGELRELNLSENSISAAGGQVLARATWLKGLRVLNLSRNHLTDTSGRSLLKAEWGEELQRLELQTNELSREMKRLLRAKYGARVRV